MKRKKKKKNKKKKNKKKNDVIFLHLFLHQGVSQPPSNQCSRMCPSHQATSVAGRVPAAPHYNPILSRVLAGAASLRRNSR
ncbi:hypothetical protein ElyMa_004601300 [Elysia marginata]|uniref:Uncharacterized protein n=1 Tax=Elysia marginata TaxID=1093978 RepID=A0AAV4I0G4_9GAST|nr:hypothetical protein ElyMa_004601300 [Elysia marginata]